MRAKTQAHRCGTQAPETSTLKNYSKVKEAVTLKASGSTAGIHLLHHCSGTMTKYAEPYWGSGVYVHIYIYKYVSCYNI